MTTANDIDTQLDELVRVLKKADYATVHKAMTEYRANDGTTNGDICGKHGWTVKEYIDHSMALRDKKIK